MDRNLLTLREVQLEEVDALKVFDAFCKNHSLSYTLIGGSLLGAIRHKGFIPWDDDIDIGMPRYCYDTFITLKDSFEEETGLTISGIFDSKLQYSPIIKVLIPGVITKERDSMFTSNLWLDLMPIDYLPESDFIYTCLVYRANILRHILSFLCTSEESSNNYVIRTIKRIAHPLRKNSKIRLSLVNIFAKRLNELAIHHTYNSLKYAGILTWGIYGKGERQNAVEMLNYVDVSFEGINVPSMQCWDTYLSSIYGEYNVIPDVTQRHEHGIVAWRA